MSAEDLSFFRITDDVAEAVREMERFHRVYHSMRYVGPLLVFRLRRRLDVPTLSAIGKEFAGLLASGTFSQTPALPDEADEPELAHLPRLAFRFNRRNFGRLRQLVDRINDAGA